jgi:hypothetical protein
MKSSTETYLVSVISSDRRQLSVAVDASKLQSTTDVSVGDCLTV